MNNDQFHQRLAASLERLENEHQRRYRRSVEAVSAALLEGAKAGKDSVVIISADATAAHQSVITVMEAARRVGLSQITFATQPSAQAGKR